MKSPGVGITAFFVVVRFYSDNNEHQMVPLSSLMINLPVKFIRGNFEYFLGRLNSYFMKRRSAPQLFVSIILLFVRTFCVNFTIFNGFKAFCRPVGKSAFRVTFHLGQ